jgi:predicted dehydrogenase
VRSEHDVTYQREHEDRLRIGLVGAGLHAYRNLLPSLTFLPVELVALCDAAEDRARITARQYGARAYTDARDMYEEVQLDAVLLSVSPALHPALMLQALTADLHVFSEKPPSLRAAELDPVIEARGDRVVLVGLKKVFSPAMAKAREAVTEFGPLVSALGTYPIGIPPDGERTLADGVESDWLVQGCHVVSVLRDVGGEVAGVQVTRGARGGGVCVLHFADGAVGTLHLGEGGPTGQPFELYRFFLDGVHVDVEDMSVVRVQRGTPMGRTVTEFAPPGWGHGAQVWQPQGSLATLENMSLFTQGFVPELSAFVDAVRGRSTLARGSLEFARDVMAIYEAALRSRGQVVEPSMVSTHRSPPTPT